MSNPSNPTTDPRPDAPLADVVPIMQAASLSREINDRLAPQDLEAECAVLGGILLTNEAIFDVAEIVRPEDFHREPHRRIFAAMHELTNRNEPIDLITLADELRKRGDLEAVGGAPAIAGLDAAVPATANLTRYARIVRDAARDRRIIEAAHRIAREGYERKGDSETRAENAQRAILDASSDAVAKGPEEAASIIRAVFSDVERLCEHKSEITGIATGFRDLDRMSGGLQRGELTVLAARPSMGKTALAMNIAERVAIDQHQPVAVFSLEMSSKSLMTRTLGSVARVEGYRLRTGHVAAADWVPLARAADRIHAAPLWVDDTAALTAFTLRSRARRLHLKALTKGEGLALVVVDYLQLMRGTGREERDDLRIGEITSGLKALAKELNCAVLALSQLNRSLEKRDEKRPNLGDLRGSGSIEQDADIVCFVHRPAVYDRHADKSAAEIIVAKQRNGPTGTVNVNFVREFTRFEDTASSPPEVPWNA